MNLESITSIPKIKTEAVPTDTPESDYTESDFIDDTYGKSGEGAVSESKNISPEKQQEDDRAVTEYTIRNENVAKKLAATEDRLNSLHLIENVDDFSEAEINLLIAERKALKHEAITASANYPGDWTNLLYKRLIDPITKEKFILQRTEAMKYMKDDPAMVSRREMPKVHYQDQIDEYEKNIEHVFSMTEVGPAESFGSRGKNLGNMGNMGVGAVFSDAEHTNTPLSNRQKNIIEAHEKGHCLRDFVSSYDRQEIQSSIDNKIITKLNALRQTNGIERIAPSYVSNPMEIAERMAQFKNYFGMGANDIFTKQHLDHIRERYVQDTGLDNGVSDLLYVVTPETEKTFLAIINKYPI